MKREGGGPGIGKIEIEIEGWKSRCKIKFSLDSPPRDPRKCRGRSERHNTGSSET